MERVHMPEVDTVAPKSVRDRTQYRVAVGVATGAIIVLMGCYFLATNPSLRSRAQLALLAGGWVPHIPFDSAAWKANTPGFDHTRGSMLRDFVRKHGLIGMPRDEVELLLGPPSRTMPAGSVIWGRRYSTIIVYDLGACSGFRMDMDELRVYLDAGGTVIAWRVVQT
jgi:hypothetical protein